jgi:hypothetical protein
VQRLYFLLGVRVSLGHLHWCDPLLGDLFWVQTKVGIVCLGITFFWFIFVCNSGKIGLHCKFAMHLFSKHKYSSCSRSISLKQFGENNLDVN